MPRDSNGVYTLPGAYNPVISGTAVQAVWANTTLADVAQGVTDSLDRSGRGGMLAPLRFADGSVGVPGAAFTNETTTGLFRASAGVVGFSILGTEVMRWTAAGLSFAGLTVTGNTSLGDAIGDTLSVSGSVVKNAAGNWTIPAPSSGVALAITSTLTGLHLLDGGSSANAIRAILANDEFNLVVRRGDGGASDGSVSAQLGTNYSGDITRGAVLKFHRGADTTGEFLTFWTTPSSGTLTERLRIAATGKSTFTGAALTATSSQAFTATPTFDANLSNVFEFSGAMTANVTSVTISNPTAGQTINIRVKQDATGGRTFATPTGAKITGSVSATISVASMLTLTYSAMDARWEGNWTSFPV